MIDIILHFASVAAAIANVSVLAHTSINDQGVRDFLADHAMQVQVWRVSQDVAGTDALGNPTVTHAYLPGLFIEISVPQITPALAALRDDPAVQVVIDRDKAANGQPGMILKSNVSAALLQDLRFSPVWAGANYPFGAWQ